MRLRLSLPLLAGFAAAVMAQTGGDPQPRMKCEGENNWGNTKRFCEIREQTIAYPGQLNVDGRENGGVAVHGWSRPDVLVRSKVETHAGTDADAKAMAGQIRVDTSAGHVLANGPNAGNDHHWAVSYEIFVPRNANLDLITQNGGVHVSDVHGTLAFSAVNGGVHLAQVGGSVKGKTVNGGLHIELSGSAWEGQGMEVQTTNGGVHLAVPANYSAHLEASTVNGGMHVEIPGAPRTSKTHQLSTNLGSGGSPLKVTTTNGGVHVTTL
jgi:DUF4097 and DUF4098 domain-containing protein YvlB